MSHKFNAPQVCSCAVLISLSCKIDYLYFAFSLFKIFLMRCTKFTACITDRLNQCIVNIYSFDQGLELHIQL